MIIHECEQGTPEWHALRTGIPTASSFDQIVTPKGDLSASSRRYMARLLAERMLKRSLEAPLDTLEHIERGRLLEPAAARAFEFENDCETIKVGFITTDDGRWGASLDRAFIGGALEIKCPSPQVHMLYYIDGFNTKYKAQVQGQLLIAEPMEAAVRFSYNTAFPHVTNRAERDREFVAKLAGNLRKFSDELDQHEITLRASGFFDERTAGLTAVDEAYSGMLDDWLLTGDGELANPMTAG